MPRCPACREWISGEREEVGSRCPSCRLPLYERPELFKPRPAADNFCSVHARNPAVGTCPRCGNFQCDLCRTRWRDRALCIACLNRALESPEATPHQARAQVWQALFALLLGIASWLVTAAGIIVAVAALAAGEGGQGRIILLGIGGLIVIASPLPAVFGVGLGAAALRARGNRGILATFGLLLSGLHVGAVIGLICFTMWQQ